jgi:hypothetical protein
MMVRPLGPQRSSLPAFLFTSVPLAPRGAGKKLQRQQRSANNAAPTTMPIKVSGPGFWSRFPVQDFWKVFGKIYRRTCPMWIS